MSPGLAYGLVWAGFVAYLGALATAPALGRRVVWGAIVVLVTGFAVAPVLLSQDVYSYVDYARLGVLHDLNPYLHPPAAAPADPAFAEVGWTEATSAYGPLFTLATYPLAWLPVGTAVAALKAAAALSVLGIAALLARLAPARGVDPLRAATLVALNPLVLVHVVGGAHNDGLAVLTAMLGVAAALAARETTAGAAFIAAFAIKPPSALAAPFAAVHAARIRLSPHQRGVNVGCEGRAVGRMVLGAASAALAIGLGAYAGFGWHWLDGLAVAGENQGRVSNYSLPNLLSELLNLDVDLIRAFTATAFLLLVVLLLLWTARGADWIRATGWAALGLLLATAWLLPWYLIWALPFAAISRDNLLIAATLSLTALQLAARIPL
jgi:glycosyl transferase family 87